MKKVNVRVYVGGEFRYALQGLEMDDDTPVCRLDFTFEEACAAALRLLRGGGVHPDIGPMPAAAVMRTMRREAGADRLTR